MEFWTQEINLEGGEFYIFSDGLMEFHYQEHEELGVGGLIQMIEGLSALPIGDRPFSLDSSNLFRCVKSSGFDSFDDFYIICYSF